MSRVPPWFERKFEFSFPVELYPNLAARLRGTPARLEEMVRGASPQALTRKIEEKKIDEKKTDGKKTDGKWLAQEHAGHLLDLEPLWSARVEDFMVGGAELTTADLTNQKTHNANHNSRPLEQILAGFRTARLALMTRLETMKPDLFARTLLHPRLKQPMRLVDHLYFVAEHDDHHLAHIWELIHARGQEAPI